MSSVVLTGSTSGSVTVQAAAVAGSNTATIGAATGTHFPFTAGTAVASTSGTSIDFTNIPSWVKRITVMFNGVSTNGTSTPIFQLGTGSSPTFVTSGYLGAGGYLSGSPATSNFTTGFGINSVLAANVIHGSVIFTNISGNIWVASGTFALSNNNVALTTAGSVDLGAAITAIRITTAGGANTFDAGSINILYE